MKGKYINIKILLACLSTKQHTKKDIHEQLQETIAEHKKIMQQFRSVSLVQINEWIETQYKNAA